jgi:hypothetical protein
VVGAERRQLCVVFELAIIVAENEVLYKHEEMVHSREIIATDERQLKCD